MRIVACLAPLLLLPACGDEAPAPAPTRMGSPAPTATASDVVATVAALPPGQRDGVIFRAIRDAGHACQEVTEVKPQPADAGTLAWLATCDRRDQWLVSMDRSGTATVINAQAAAAAAR